MKITVSTEKLKSMVSRAIKCVSNNKALPITSLLAIKASNGSLTLVTTDATNYLYVTERGVVTEDFYAVVDANKFSKLISKMTCDTTILEINSRFLSVKGNGNYKFDIQTDENDEVIRYPDPVAKLDMSNATTTTINRSTVQVILETIKSALAVTLENPCYTGYYMGQNVVATDTFKIASMNVPIFDVPRLVSPEFFDLLSVMLAEKIEVNIVNNDIVCSTPDCVVCGKFMEGIEEFAIKDIMNLVNTEFNSFCSIPKTALLQLLDRLSLFVGPYDKNAVYLTFTQDGLQVSSKTANSVEIINYVSSDKFKNFTCAVDIQMLTQEIKSIKADVIEMYYGEDNAIKMTDGNITIVIALLEDDEVSE